MLEVPSLAFAPDLFFKKVDFLMVGGNDLKQFFFAADRENEKVRKRRGVFYAIIIGFVFIASHYMAANYSEEPAGFCPPYVEKKVGCPELYKKQDAGDGSDKNNNVRFYS